MLDYLKECYRKLVEEDDPSFITDEYKSNMLDLFGDLIKYYNGQKESLEKYTLDDINNIAEYALKIANIVYNNYGEIGEIVDDNPYDELSYLYKRKTKKFIFGAPTTRKKNVDVKHNYPELKGTLSKVRYIYKCDADAVGKPGDSLEEFLNKYYDTTYSRNGKTIECVCSLKYDGISAVVDIDDDGSIIQILTRGDNDMGADITKTFKNYKFPQLKDDIEFMGGKRFGLQCEAVFKKNKLDEFNKKFGKSYVNGRSAMVGIASSYDIGDCSEYVTLMPLNTSRRPIDCVNRNEEFESINRNIDMETEWIYITGNSPWDILSKFELFKNDFLNRREEYPYMVDGIVIEFNESLVRLELGRTNNINNFAIAYKFPSQSKLTEVLDVTYSVGRTGEVVPKVHYRPVYFNGGEFKKTTLSNITNFMSMGLRKGDIINVQYNNDVLCYVTKDPSLKENRMNKEPLIEFPSVCPYCGEKLSLLQENGAKIYCLNRDCPSRIVENIINFLNKLNIKDIGSETVQFLYDNKLISDIPSLAKFDTTALNGLDGFGAKKITIIQDALSSIYENQFTDAEVLGALGIRSASVTTFTPICKRFNFEEILDNGSLDRGFELSLSSMKGFGAKKSAIIVSELNHVLFGNPEMLNMIRYMNIEYTYCDNIEDEIQDGVKVCYSGIRDSSLDADITRKGGFVVNSITKDTDILIVKDATSRSTKIDKAHKYGILVISYAEFKSNFNDVMNKYLDKYKQ